MHLCDGMSPIVFILCAWFESHLNSLAGVTSLLHFSCLVVVIIVALVEVLGIASVTRRWVRHVLHRLYLWVRCCTSSHSCVFVLG